MCVFVHRMAEEAPKIRLVRCPKCGNVLPEPPNHSVYLCGGCHAVLRGQFFICLLLFLFVLSSLCFNPCLVDENS